MLALEFVVALGVLLFVLGILFGWRIWPKSTRERKGDDK